MLRRAHDHGGSPCLRCGHRRHLVQRLCNLGLVRTMIVTLVMTAILAGSVSGCAGDVNQRSHNANQALPNTSVGMDIEPSIISQTVPPGAVSLIDYGVTHLPRYVSLPAGIDIRLVTDLPHLVMVTADSTKARSIIDFLAAQASDWGLTVVAVSGNALICEKGQFRISVSCAKECAVVIRS